MAGLLMLKNNAQLDADYAARAAAELRQSEPLIQGLAAHLRSLWEPARQAKDVQKNKMLRALRQRNGEYEADVLAEIAEQGGSKVFMMLSETKCRGAESWLRDVLLDEGMIPFSCDPTPVQDLPPEVQDRVHKNFADKVLQTIEQTGFAPDSEEMEDLKSASETDIREELMDEAQEAADNMKTLISDQFFEGGMIQGFNDFISDLATYPNAFLKGPVVRRQRRLTWGKDAEGRTKPVVTEELVPTYERCDPFHIYPEPGISRLEDGYLFEHHRLSRPELSALIGCPGYDSDAIRQVLDNMPNNNMASWLWSAEMQKSELEQKHLSWMRPTRVVDALEFTGKIDGKSLREWGMSIDEIPDEAVEYDVNVWLVDRWVIKATLNYDPLGRKPYYTTSFIKRPGALWGSSLPEVIEDVQQLCNAAARALANNMGLASGPLVEVNIDRLPDDEEITTLKPWQIYQTLNDPLGSGQPAVHFNQPDDRSQPLMTVYTHFCKLADDQSGIPAYVYGDMNVTGAGRTASGLSMLMGSAGKGIRQVVMHIDMDVIEPAVVAQFNYNMRYVDDETLKGDIRCRAKGAIVLANREQLNVRRVEFLQATANPIDQEIVGKPGRAAVLREVAKGLSMPVDEIVPSKEKMAVQEKMEAVLQQQQMAQPQPDQTMEFSRDPNGAVTGAAVFPGGAKKGGGDANTVSNKQTGRAA